MIVESDYRGYRIEVNAEAAGGVWNAQVRIRRILSEDKPRVVIVTCRKPMAKVAEERAVIYARRWIDRQARRSL